ncbi:MAG: hypothetical protein QNJ46_16345 [Leptolyngbyaceae cyanobacterium MO_188.B28]|nr:hypothetical protein [Leptolyngbyaceae cyanobacterium MO_188.B28]
MKSLFQLAATLSLVGGALLAPLPKMTTSALALPQSEIISKLSSVPVFIIVDTQGRSLMASTAENQEAQVPLVFIDGEDAESFLNNAQAQNAEFANQAQVAPIWLGDLYQQAQTQPDGPTQLAYIPIEEQLESATTIQDSFQGVPLFVARFSDSTYLTVRQEGEPVLPLFFTQEDLQIILDRFGQEQPDVANEVQIEVISLEGVIQTMQSSDDPELDKIRFFPSSEVVQYIRSNFSTDQSSEQSP